MTASAAPAAVMLGTSAAIVAVQRSLALVARSEIAVLLTGETGVGKEVAAVALHAASGRRGSLVPVNGCTFSDSMFDAAFFGHEPGAFTGAVSRRAGYLTEADGGTLFLDEICSLPLDSQSKLLRAIETRRYRRLGAPADSESRFRVVSASNRPLRAEAQAGRFRLDLLHRLRGIEIRIPPLRERREDIPVLLRHFLRELAYEGGAPSDVDPRALDMLMSHSWPGNVRELLHVVRLSVLLAQGAPRIRTEHVVLEATADWPSEAVGSEVAREVRLLRDALERHHWDTRLVALELDVSRKTVYERMRRLGIATKRAASLREPCATRRSGSVIN